MEKVVAKLRAGIQTLELSLAAHEPECGLRRGPATLPEFPDPGPSRAESVMDTLRVARPGKMKKIIVEGAGILRTFTLEQDLLFLFQTP